MNKAASIKELRKIPGVGISIANDLWNIGIHSIADLQKQDPQQLFDASNEYAGAVQDRCLLYVFRCAVYYAETPVELHDKEQLKWWNWKINAYLLAFNEDEQDTHSTVIGYCFGRVAPLPG